MISTRLRILRQEKFHHKKLCNPSLNNIDEVMEDFGSSDSYDKERELLNQLYQKEAKGDKVEIRRISRQ